MIGKNWALNSKEDEINIQACELIDRVGVRATDDLENINGDKIRRRHEESWVIINSIKK